MDKWIPVKERLPLYKGDKYTTAEKRIVKLEVKNREDV